MGWTSEAFQAIFGLVDANQTNRFNRESLDRMIQWANRQYGIGQQFNVRDVFSAAGLGRPYGIGTGRQQLTDQFYDPSYDPTTPEGVDREYQKLFEEMPDFTSDYKANRDFQLVKGSDYSGDLNAARDEIGGLAGDVTGIYTSGRAGANAAIGRAVDAIRSGKIEPGSLFGQVDLPTEASFSDRTNANLQGIAASSGAQQSQAEQQALAQAFASGQGLTGAGGAMSAIAAQAAQDRALRSAGARSEGERGMDEFQRFRSGLQAELGTVEANLNAGLAQSEGSALTAQAGILGNLASSEAGSRIGAGQVSLGLLDEIARLREQDINVDQFNEGSKEQYASNYANLSGQDFANLGNAMQARTGARSNAINQRLAAMGLSANTQLGGAGGGANTISQYTPNMFSYSGLMNDIMANYMAKNQPKPKGGGGFEMFGFGLSASCIDARCEVETQDGPKPLFLVEQGDKVRGADGQFHAVVETDVGTTPTGADLYAVGQDGWGFIAGTGDHVVDGVRLDRHAGRHPWNCQLLADIKLEGNADYVINGFRVASAIGRNETLAKLAA